MTNHFTVLADEHRIRQFSALAQISFANRSQTFRDTSGMLWAVVSELAAAIPLIGAGWHFDPAARAKWSERNQERRSEIEAMPENEQAESLADAVQSFRFGALSERLVWVIHQEVIRNQQSCFEIADLHLRDILWGKQAPRHWRQTLKKLLDSLQLLHLGPQHDNRNFRDFGARTAILSNFVVRPHNSRTACPAHCALAGGRAHSHVLINTGRGLLGCLEDLAENQDGAAVRQYHLRDEADSHEQRQAKEQLLRRIGKGGALTTVYLPGMIGDREVCQSFTARQRLLLQLVVREGTRDSKKRKQDVSQLEQFTGNMVAPVTANRRAGNSQRIRCDLLDKDGSYVGFNGNKARKGRGYKLSTWVSRCGSTDAASFLKDVGVLAERLSLIVAAIKPGVNRFIDLNQLEQLATQRPHAAATYHVRFYSRADFAERWNRLFGWKDLPTDQQILGNALVAQGLLAKQGIPKVEAARAIGVDPSAFGKMLAEKRKLSDERLVQLQTWVDERSAPLASSAQAAPPVAPPTTRTTGLTMLDQAFAYRRLGWSVIPQRCGDKKPCVKWKAYQQELPSEEQIEEWWTRWPKAGIILIAGPLSNAFVVDVDSAEAHAVLLERLGGLPTTPTAQTGSGDPDRFHIFFQHPPLQTKAKATPWHPKLEFRGDAGLIVLPPSMHKSEKRYAWLPGKSAFEVALQSLPGIILDSLVPRTTATAPPETPVDVSLAVAPSTHEFLTGNYAAGPGWNDRLFRAACDLKGRCMSLDEATPLLIAGAQPWDEGERAAAHQTIASAFAQTREPSRT